MTAATKQADRLSTEQLSTQVRTVLEGEAETVPFHNWQHTDFVRNKAVEFANERKADVLLVEAAALVHDLNYVVAPKSAPSAGRPMRKRLLATSGFSPKQIRRIEQIVDGAHIAHRQKQVDAETACLSDADTLYKVLPITPVLFAHRYLAENEMALEELAKKIIREQVEKLQNDYYFYDQTLAKRYRPWAEANLKLWEAISESLSDPDVAALVEEASNRVRQAHRRFSRSEG